MNKFGILFLTITLFSCSDSTETSAIISAWETDACEQLSDLSNQPVNIWSKSIYTFDIDGSIYSKSTSYSDSNCVTESSAISASSQLVAIYSDQGPVTTSQGIEANKISIIFSSSPPPIITTNGYYKITNNQLCLSQSFHFDADGFGIGTVNDTDIDFTSCLTKNEP